MGDDGEAPAPPYHLVDNTATWLTFTDLVFIDPVTTGYSREAAGEDPQQFHGLQQDIQSVGDFIRLYTTRFGRWSSPKFLAGESYGTTRAAGLSGAVRMSTPHALTTSRFHRSSSMRFQSCRASPRWNSHLSLS